MVRVSSPAKLRPWPELTAKMVMGVVPALVRKGFLLLGARLRGRTLTQCPKKGSENQGAPKGRQQKGETGTGTHIFADFRRFSLNVSARSESVNQGIWESQICAESRRKPQIFVNGRGSQKGSEKGACYGFYNKRGFWEGFSEGVLRRQFPEGA